VLMALEMRDAIRALTEKWRGLGHDWLHRHCARVCHARCNRLQGTVRFIPPLGRYLMLLLGYATKRS
jgi:hypothetical protein